jgi:hypothetical protein
MQTLRHEKSSFSARAISDLFCRSVPSIARDDPLAIKVALRRNRQLLAPPAAAQLLTANMTRRMRFSPVVFRARIDVVNVLR